MGATWVRSDGQAGSIDLGEYLSEHDHRHSGVNLVSELGVEYTLTPTDETTLSDGLITPVRLRSVSNRLPDDELDTLLLLPLLAFYGVKNWGLERRHFPKSGFVSLKAETLAPGQSVTINNRQTRPIVRGWVHEAGQWLPNF